MAAASSFFRYLALIIILLRNVDADTLDAFSFNGSGSDESSFGFYGDAKLVNGSSNSSTYGYSSVSLSDGRLVYQNPVKFVQGEPRNLVSFSTYFSVLLAPDSTEGVAFFMVPVAFVDNGANESLLGFFTALNESKIRVFVAGFDALKDGNGGSLNKSNVGVDVSGLASVLGVNNVSSTVSLDLNSGDILHCWIDYQAGSRRFEIRLSKSGDVKPTDPSFVYSVDLSNKWKEEEVFIGLSSSSKNSSHPCRVYSWSLKLWVTPRWMHSEPLDPGAISTDDAKVQVLRKSSCGAKVLGALVFGTGCGALGAFLVLFAWSFFVSRRPVAPEEVSGCPGPEVYDCSKVVFVVDKTIKDGQK